MKEVLLKIPKSELHIHLRGAMPVEVFTNLLNKYSATGILQDAPDRLKAVLQRYENIRPFLSPRHWSVNTVSDLFRYETFDQFLATYAFTGFFVRDASDLRRLITGVLEMLKSQNVVYVEITTSVAEYLRQGIPLADIKACLEETVEFPGIRVQWIVDLVRDFGSEAALALLKQIIDLKCKGIVGITLGGSEHRFPPDQFSEVYFTARDHGLRLTVHAGEALGPQSVWDALQILGAERIGHGVRAIEDKSLVTYLAENDIPLEVCPTSNLRTGIFPSYEAHPVKALFEAGVPMIINSDDPTFFGTTLADEYVHVHHVGVQGDDIFEMVKNGFKYTFLPKKEIESYLENLEQEWEKLYPPAL
ncbi:MAG: adenosine deaminase [Candidatus Bipolaricaulia bacterium]